MAVRNMGITRDIVPKSRRTTRKGNKGMKPPKKWKNLIRRNQRRK